LRSRIVFCEFLESFQKFGSLAKASTFASPAFSVGASKILLKFPGLAAQGGETLFELLIQHRAILYFEKLRIKKTFCFRTFE
jgi:hypothetical protein